MVTTTLVGFAALPADTFADGPLTGQGITGNGRTGPFPGPPVQGFSGVQFAESGNYWFLSDNGFGSKLNSTDYPLRLYRVDPNFRESSSGDGSVTVLSFIQLSDPDRKIPFSIQNENTSDRILTGGDFDPESFVIAADGTIWIGEEFGPYLLQFDATGKLLQAPIPTPNFAQPGAGDPSKVDLVRSPDNPDVLAGTATANLSRSRGYEGMAVSPDKSKFYPMLEGPVTGDPNVALRIYEFDPKISQFTGLKGFYRMDAPGHAIGDFTVINDREFLVIERDNGQAATAQFKKVFKIDLTQTDSQGYFVKQEVANLLNVQDPNDLNRDGSTTFTFPFVTIENVLVIDADTILVANDNNYPFSLGRPPAIDNNEIILLDLAQPLNLDSRVGLPGLNRSQNLTGTADANLLITGSGDDTICGLAGDDQLFAGDGKNEVYGDRGNDRIQTGSGDDLIFGGLGNDTISAGTGTNTINGGRGDNVIISRGIDDIVVDRSGANRFDLVAGTGIATIRGFTSNDKISLGGGLTFSALTISSSRRDTLITVTQTGDLLAVLKGVQSSTLTSATFA